MLIKSGKLKSNVVDFQYTGGQARIMLNRLIFSNRLKKLQTDKKLSCSQLATLLNFQSKGSIGNLEAGKSLPLADKLYLIAEFFGVSIDYLTGRIDDPQYEKFQDKEN